MKNKVVLITGELTGIGRATASAFAREGARVIVSAGVRKPAWHVGAPRQEFRARREGRLVADRVDAEMSHLRFIRFDDAFEAVEPLSRSAALDPEETSAVVIALPQCCRGHRSVTVEEGEALFEVAKDPHRPFVVRAGGSEVCALGSQSSGALPPSGRASEAICLSMWPAATSTTVRTRGALIGRLH